MINELDTLIFFLPAKDVRGMGTRAVSVSLLHEDRAEEPPTCCRQFPSCPTIPQLSLGQV